MHMITKTGALGIGREKWLEATAPPPPYVYKGRTPKQNASERRLYAWINSHPASRRRCCAAARLAKELGVSMKRLLEATKGQPFRFDFGRDRKGRLLTIFVEVPLRRWALGQADKDAQARSSATRGARPRLAIARAA